jgi:hypothetical protein
MVGGPALSQRYKLLFIEPRGCTPPYMSRSIVASLYYTVNGMERVYNNLIIATNIVRNAR